MYPTSFCFNEVDCWYSGDAVYTRVPLCSTSFGQRCVPRAIVWRCISHRTVGRRLFYGVTSQTWSIFWTIWGYFHKFVGRVLIPGAIAQCSIQLEFNTKLTTSIQFVVSHSVQHQDIHLCIDWCGLLQVLRTRPAPCCHCRDLNFSYGVRFMQ